MKRKVAGMFQFKITLQDVKPAVWRRIQTPTGYSFWDLHVAIQDVMGWRDAHLHEFRVAEPKTGEMVAIGIPDDGDFGDEHEVAQSWERSIADYFSMENPAGSYVYDFGDDWNHEIILEEAATGDRSVKSPVFVDGKGTCPPEDCGGPFGYAEFLRAIKKPGSPRGSELLEWVGGAFDPNAFDGSKVEFDDPMGRWNWSFRDSVLLENELRSVMAVPRKCDRQGRVPYRIPRTQHHMILNHATGLDDAILEQINKAIVENEEVILKLDDDELKALSQFLASVEKKAKRVLDRRIFGALREHFLQIDLMLRGV